MNNKLVKDGTEIIVVLDNSVENRLKLKSEPTKQSEIKLPFKFGEMVPVSFGIAMITFGSPKFEVSTEKAGLFSIRPKGNKDAEFEIKAKSIAEIKVTGDRISIDILNNINETPEGKTIADEFKKTCATVPFECRSKDGETILHLQWVQPDLKKEIESIDVMIVEIDAQLKVFDDEVTQLKNERDDADRKLSTAKSAYDELDKRYQNAVLTASSLKEKKEKDSIFNSRQSKSNEVGELTEKKKIAQQKYDTKSNAPNPKKIVLKSEREGLENSKTNKQRELNDSQK